MIFKILSVIALVFIIYVVYRFLKYKDSEYKTYSINYRFKGDTWEFRIEARSWKEAEDRLRHIRSSSEVTGEIVLDFPIPHK